MKIITQTHYPSLTEVAKELNLTKLRWISDILDSYGYDWDFVGEYALTPEGDLVSFKHCSPTVLSPLGKEEYPFFFLYTQGERLAISLSQLIKQVWGEEARLPKHYCVRKNGIAKDIRNDNLQQARHWTHVRSPKPGHFGWNSPIKSSYKKYSPGFIYPESFREKAKV